jgi:hypothetical protein
MHLVSHISDSIRWMGSGDNFTTNISGWLHIGNVNEAYRSTNKVNYFQQMLKHNKRCTGPDYLEETLSYVGLKAWYNIDTAKVVNIVSALDTRTNTHWANLLRLHHCLKDQFFRPISVKVYHLRETHVRGVHRSILLTSPRDSSVDFGIPNFQPLFRIQIEEDGEHEVRWLVLRYDQYVLIDSVFMKLQNGRLYYRQPFHYPTSVERLGLDCKVEYMDANHGIMAESHNIWV